MHATIFPHQVQNPTTPSHGNNELNRKVKLDLLDSATVSHTSPPLLILLTFITISIRYEQHVLLIHTENCQIFICYIFYITGIFAPPLGSTFSIS